MVFENHNPGRTGFCSPWMQKKNISHQSHFCRQQTDKIADLFSTLPVAERFPEPFIDNADSVGNAKLRSNWAVLF